MLGNGSHRIRAARKAEMKDRIPFRVVSAIKIGENSLLEMSRDQRSLQEFDGTIYQTPLLGQDMTQGQFFKRSLTGLNSEFSFS